MAEQEFANGTLTDHLAARERLVCPTLQAAHRGNDAAFRLDRLKRRMEHERSQLVEVWRIYEATPDRLRQGIWPLVRAASLIFEGTARLYQSQIYVELESIDAQ